MPSDQRVFLTTMITKVGLCPRCSSPASHTFGELVVETRFAWWESWSCETCGVRSECDGIDRLSDGLRADVITSEGSYRVRVLPKGERDVVDIQRKGVWNDAHRCPMGIASP